jgi:hypothetical protein
MAHTGASFGKTASCGPTNQRRSVAISVPLTTFTGAENWKFDDLMTNWSERAASFLQQ